DPKGNPVSYSITEGSEFASVDNNGLVTAKAEGTAKVNVTSDSVTKDIIVNVTRVKTKRINVTPETVNIDAESTQQQSAVTDPKGSNEYYSDIEEDTYSSEKISRLVSAKP